MEPDAPPVVIVQPQRGTQRRPSATSPVGHQDNGLAQARGREVRDGNAAPRIVSQRGDDRSAVYGAPMERAGLRPRVRINQLGYLSALPKRAVWVSEAREPARFRVLAPDGSEVFAARTEQWRRRPEPASGLAVHELDFSAVRSTGDGFVVDVEDARSHPFAIGEDLYRGLVRDALGFFYLQRSGCAIDEARAPGYGRPAGHPGDAAVAAWAGPDAERLYPGWSCPGRFDVSGGWYDAGDHGKYPTSGAMPVWQLLATVELIRRGGRRSAWSKQTEALLVEECRWQLDWLLRMQVPAGRPHAGLAFHRVHGTEWAPLPCWPHQDPTTRVLHRPSTAAGLHLAAAAAHGARVLCDDSAYARRLLSAAVTAYEAALAEPSLLAPDDHGAFGGGPYAHDDLAGARAWAAAELWLATREPRFAIQARRALAPDAFHSDGFDCDGMSAVATLELALHDADERAAEHVGAAGERLLALQAAQPWGQPYAPPDGWDWGSNGRVLNNLVVLAIAHELSGRRAYLDAAARGMDYLLGCNALGQSYVSGYGPDCTRRLRTRHFAHALDPTFPPPPAGALAGGPTSKHHPGFPTDPRLVGLPPQRCYLDEPTSETTNDVCIRWNAPLVWMAAYLTP
jgi:endoglucanase